jgi:hypothetical protein
VQFSQCPPSYTVHTWCDFFLETGESDLYFIVGLLSFVIDSAVRSLERAKYYSRVRERCYKTKRLLVHTVGVILCDMYC